MKKKRKIDNQPGPNILFFRTRHEGKNSYCLRLPRGTYGVLLLLISAFFFTWQMVHCGLQKYLWSSSPYNYFICLKKYNVNQKNPHSFVKPRIKMIIHSKLKILTLRRLVCILLQCDVTSQSKREAETDTGSGITQNIINTFFHNIFSCQLFLSQEDNGRKYIFITTPVFFKQAMWSTTNKHFLCGWKML